MGDQDLQVREELGKALPTHDQNSGPHISVGCHSPPKNESSPTCLQAVYWKKVSLISFRQILPKTLPVVHIFSFIMTTIWKNSF